MNNTLRRCTQFTVFLGSILGQDYEVVLYDVRDIEHSIVAISNSKISSKKLGDPMDEKNLELLKCFNWRDTPYVLNYGTVSKENKVLRGSTFFITNEKEELMALMCVNFDDSNYRELYEKLLNLCHPDKFLDTSIQFVPEVSKPKSYGFNLNGKAQDPETIINAVIKSMEDELGVARSKFSKKNKVVVMKRLRDKGVFNIKGSIKLVAEALDSSIATTYRYYNEVK